MESQIVSQLHRDLGLGAISCPLSASSILLPLVPTGSGGLHVLKKPIHTLVQTDYKNGNQPVRIAFAVKEERHDEICVCPELAIQSRIALCSKVFGRGVSVSRLLPYILKCGKLVGLSIAAHS